MQADPTLIGQRQAEPKIVCAIVCARTGHDEGAVQRSPAFGQSDGFGRPSPAQTSSPALS
jgi:hypothetical protein